MNPVSYSSRKPIVCLVITTSVMIGCVTDKANVPTGPVEAAANGERWQRIPGDASISASIRYFGFVDVTQDEDNESQYFEAGFARFDRAAALSLLLNNFRQPVADSCDYRQQAHGDSTPMEFKDELDFPGHPYEFVSVGRKIEVFAGNRRYARLARTSSEETDAVQYETDVGSLPLSIGGFRLGDLLLKTRGLSVSSDGDVFPAFSGIAVPDVDLVAGFKPSVEQQVMKDTLFRWRKGRHASDPGVRLQIEAGGGGRAIFCAATDDGEFQFPQEVKARLPDASIPNPSAYRDAVWFYLRDDALLIVTQSSYY